jgi:hypothetical protein
MGEHMSVAENEAGQDRTIGCLLGGAIGDALGYPLEFVSSWRKIVAQHGQEAPERLAYADPPPALIIARVRARISRRSV